MRRGAFLLPVNDEGKVLLVQSLSRKEYAGMWSLPGGIVEQSESFENCAIRETIEETGLVCKIINLNLAYDDFEHQIEVKIFNALAASGDISLQSEEIADAKWFKVEEALRLPLAYNTAEVISNIK